MAITVCVRCEYPDQPPTEVAFAPGAGLGGTPDVVHARIIELLETREYVELPAVGGPPVPLWRETVREVVVR